MDTADQPADVDAAAASVDLVLDRHRRGILTDLEAVGAVIETVREFVRWSLDFGDADLIFDYGRHAVECLASCGGTLVEPVLVDLYDEQVDSGATTDELQARLSILLESTEREAAKGSMWALDTIGEMCRSGHRTHRLLLMLTTAAEEILDVAYRVRHADALHDAVSPRFGDAGQIAHPVRNRRAFRVAMDSLAHLAADPRRGTAARAALLDLADYVETAGEAVVRLPLHLLDDSDRARLLEVHERRVALFTDQPIIVPLGLNLLRDNRVVENALWQAYDARHLK